MDALQAALFKPVLVLGFETNVLAMVIAGVFAAAAFFALALNKKQIALDPEKWHPFKLIEIENISHDVRRFRFGLHTKNHVLGLPIGQHISFKYKDAEGKDVQRSYTPVSSDDEIGYVDFVIKVYFRDTNPRFPEGGKMSQHLESLKIGDTMLMKGPKGHLEYLGKGEFTIAHKKHKVDKYKKRKIGMVAGGTGITPMLQVIRAIVKDPSDNTEVWLMFGNQTEEDILLRKELEAIPKNKLHLFYTLDRPPAHWNQGVGFVTKDMCKHHLPPAGDDTMIFMCGPPLMMKSIQDHLISLGLSESDFFAF